jgi:uncharacterized protein (TIGR02301 family)
MLKRALTLVLITGLATAPALGQEKKSKVAEEDAKIEAPPVVEKPAPYDPKLMRLAEILGSVSYLRNLCKGNEQEWRQMMQDLLAEDTTNEPKRAASLTAAFNRGYRSFASTYVKCTSQAIAAEVEYRAEGATLATEITSRFGN